MTTIDRRNGLRPNTKGNQPDAAEGPGSTLTRSGLTRKNQGIGTSYSAESCRLASARRTRCPSVTSGYFRSSDRIAVVTTSATTARVVHLRSAGTTYQGAHSVLVAERQSE